MALLGTFLVRSGVLQSIHAFGDNTVGPYILGLIGVVLIGSTVLIVSRLDDLRSEKRIDSLVSRESVFLVNNLLLVALTAVIAWGTFFPLISELFTGTKASLAAPWFDRYTTPLAILLVLFTGIGPLLAWRRVTWASAKRVFRIPLIVAAVAAVALVLFTDTTHKPWAFALFVFAAFAIAGLAQEFWNGAAARHRLSGESMPVALVGIVSRNRRRYGGYIIHIGIAVLLIGIAASSSFQTNRDLNLRPGQSTVVDGRKITYVKPTASVDKLAFEAGALIRVEEEGGKTFTENPSTSYYRLTGQGSSGIAGYFGGQSDSSIGLQAGFGHDFWIAVRPDISAVQRRARAADKGFAACVEAAPGTPAECKAVGALMRAARDNPSLQPIALAQIEKLQLLTAASVAKSYLTESPAASFKVLINPLVTWMWIGGLIALMGAITALWPTRGRRRGALVRTEADAQKEAKYREIRDAELDHASGKLSDEDFAVLDAELRREAVEILDRVEAKGNGNGARANGDDVAGNGDAATGNGDGTPEKLKQS
jgi:cytochrome c-type biogenesis protein CcmF